MKPPFKPGEARPLLKAKFVDSTGMLIHGLQECVDEHDKVCKETCACPHHAIQTARFLIQAYTQLASAAPAPLTAREWLTKELDRRGVTEATKKKILGKDDWAVELLEAYAHQVREQWEGRTLKAEAELTRITQERDALKEEIDADQMAVTNCEKLKVAREGRRHWRDRAIRAEFARDALAFKANELCQRAERAEAALREARDLLQRFRDKLKVILPKVDSFIVLQAARTGNPHIYDGPSIEQEMEEADSLLALKSSTPAEAAC